MQTLTGAAAGTKALVWFKRDLRVRDHAALAEAVHFENALGLVVIEPQWLQSPECDPRHVGFLLDCVNELQRDLAMRGLPLLVRTGAMPQVLQSLRREFPFTHLFSHEETGPGWSYARDLAVAEWCRSQGVIWTESPQTGVVRRLRSRAGWAGRWAQRMNAPEAPTARGFRAAQGLEACAVPTLHELGLPALSVPLPPGGERAAWATLDSFLGGRGRDYRRTMSSPLTATDGCSRLSAHLAFGTISMHCVHQATEARIAATPDRSLAYALRGFASRLRWHCHFMQKLEDEPAIEGRNVARTVDGLRPGDGVHPSPVDAERLQAWCEGRTGYPMVDACMRQLRATGWLNFRMRAMLVSFAAYHLWLHWREPGLFLARQFLDFEPGIHWSQMQMQSGTTGINTLRIYSPAKQARDQDPQGLYIRQWLPEIGTAAYPNPIVDERVAVAAAKEKLYALRQTREAHTEASAIQHKHGSRKSGLPPTVSTGRRARAAPKGQGQLFQSSVLIELQAFNHGEVIMNLFNKLPGSVRSAPGWEQRIWRRLPAILLWGTLLPLVLAGVSHALAPAAAESGASNGALLLWDYQMIGVVVLHWTLVLTLALGCFIVRVMKGPAYVADAYPLPGDKGASMTRP